jgi:hypothetical protein
VRDCTLAVCVQSASIASLSAYLSVHGSVISGTLSIVTGYPSLSTTRLPDDEGIRGRMHAERRQPSAAKHRFRGGYHRASLTRSTRRAPSSRGRPTICSSLEMAVKARARSDHPIVCGFIALRRAGWSGVGPASEYESAFPLAGCRLPVGQPLPAGRHDRCGVNRQGGDSGTLAGFAADGPR